MHFRFDLYLSQTGLFSSSSTALLMYGPVIRYPPRGPIRTTEPCKTQLPKQKSYWATSATNLNFGAHQHWPLFHLAASHRKPKQPQVSSPHHQSMRRPRDGRTGGRKGGAATTASSRRGRTPRSAALLPSSGNLLPPPPDAASRGPMLPSQPSCA